MTLQLTNGESVSMDVYLASITCQQWVGCIDSRQLLQPSNWPPMRVTSAVAYLSSLVHACIPTHGLQSTDGCSSDSHLCNSVPVHVILVFNEHLFTLSLSVSTVQSLQFWRSIYHYRQTIHCPKTFKLK